MFKEYNSVSFELPRAKFEKTDKLDRIYTNHKDKSRRNESFFDWKNELLKQRLKSNEDLKIIQKSFGV